MNWWQKNIMPLFNGFNSFGFNTVRFMNPNASYSNYNTDELKLNAVFNHPAVLKVFALQMDIGSMAEVYVYKDGKEVPDHEILKRFEKPNPFQTKAQFFADYVLWNMIGTDYLYTYDRGIDSDYTKQYFLNSAKIEWPVDVEKLCDKMILSKGSENELMNKEVTYRYSDGEAIKIKLKDISIFPDLTNGVGNWFKSPSRIDALYKVISNSEAALDSLNVNIRYSGKYVVDGNNDKQKIGYDDINMTEIEKNNIDNEMNKEGKIVYPTKSTINIRRFVENIANLKLDEIYFSQYYIIASMYGINRDLAEAYLKDGSKFNNQAVALSRHISYTMQPKFNKLADERTVKFGLKEKGEKIVISFDHLPVMQKDAKEQAEVNKVKSETLLNLIKAQVPLSEINELLDTKFTNLDYESAKQNNTQETEGEGESNLNA